MMLEHLQLDTAAAAIHRAVADLLRTGGPRTPDLKGTAKTGDVGKAVVERIRA
jgi:tartrate dehydrogenase/decarboxylase/D-malate dehydrogenase